MEIVEDKKYLTSEAEIEAYFKDCGHEYFDCGQGYFQEFEEMFVKIGNQHYTVGMHAEIEGTKQDRGDRLYYVESISAVTHEKVSLEYVKIVINKDTVQKILSLQNKIDKLKEQLI